jgi:small-conductance mechanosensitive channel
VNSTRRRTLQARLRRQERQTARLRKARLAGVVVLIAGAVVTTVLPAFLATGAARLVVPVVLAALWVVLAAVFLTAVGGAVRAGMLRAAALRRELEELNAAQLTMARVAAAIADVAAAAADRTFDLLDAAADVAEGVRATIKPRRSPLRYQSPDLSRRPVSSPSYDPAWTLNPAVYLPLIL